MSRALDKREIYDDFLSSFSLKPYDMTPHLNSLIETFQMRDHKVCFYAELTKIIANYHQIHLEL